MQKINIVLYCKKYNLDAYYFNELADVNFCMTVEMTVFGGIRGSARKCSHTDAMQTTQHLSPLIVNLGRLKHLSLLSSVTV
jgi:hypothetical protein